MLTEEEVIEEYKNNWSDGEYDADRNSYMSDKQVIKFALHMANKSSSSNIINNYIDWLMKRIIKTEKQRNKAKNFDIKITKGAKLTTFRECLNNIKQHKE